MPVKKAKKAAPKKTAVAKRRGQAYECGVCGYRVVVDEACGCEEEHVFICCDKPLRKVAARKPARRPAAKTAKKKK